ncbi:MAG TPA: ATP-binding cassette domain-containing protein [Solirubrobacterales bacterium]|nr:ATP-binding cassette domain-containing protein [Solirubrobacterales bacterium]
MAAEPLLEVESLRKVFPGHRGHPEVAAVDGVSFTVREGEAVALVGESGSGKTTTARIVVGLERQTAGEVSVCGRPREPAARVTTRERRRRGREAQIVFQDPYSSLDPCQKIGSAITEVARLHFGLDRAECAARLADLLDQVGLREQHASALPRTLSGGERQRVAIACALAAEPRLLILDEAVSALDVSIQAQILNLLADVRERTRITYLFVSHDLAVVRQVADRVLVMRAGRVVEEGPTQRVLDQPQDPYTQLLLDSVPRPGWKPTRAIA